MDSQLSKAETSEIAAEAYVYAFRCSWATGSDTPIRLTPPRCWTCDPDLYYVMQFEDLLGYNELFIGSRATGTDPGSHVLMGPTYEGEVPDGFASSFRFETEIVFLIGQCGWTRPPAMSASLGT